MTTTTPQRIGGWLLGPLAWLLVALLSTTLALLLYTAALSSPQTFQTLGGQALTTQILWGVSFITAIGARKNGLLSAFCEKSRYGV